MKQPTYQSAHKKQRDKHRNQRSGHRHNRETDLPRAFECRLESPLTLFDVPIHILDDHNGIIDDEPDRNGDRHQRKIIEAVMEQIHAAEGRS